MGELQRGPTSGGEQALAAMERLRAASVQRIAEREEAIRAELAELLAPFHEALPSALAEAGLPTDEAGLRQAFGSEPRLGARQGAMLRALASAELHSEHVVEVLARHTGRPAQAFTLVDVLTFAAGEASHDPSPPAARPERP
ncbi:MAG TPA: hypothetical protein VE972_13725 [Conexibacter sp.]|nr:hypothetical protein [Conexibacter sp.]